MISRTMYHYFFWLCLLSTGFLSLLPMGGEQLFELQDKVGHGGVYGILFFLAVQAYGHRYPLWVLGLVLAAFGLGMEIAQSMTTYRQGDAWDMLANSSGILIVWAIFAWRRHTE